MMIYTAQDRDRLLEELIAAARSDARISGAAMTGSASVGLADRWSDIDLAFGIAEQPALAQTLADWTERMYGQHEAVHHVDVVSGATIYRVFLLRNTLQVDLAFSPAAEFGARGPTFRLLFGDAVAGLAVPAGPTAAYLIGFGWLYALHARACIQRAQWWRAEYMVRGVRDSVLTLACLRCGLPLSQARGVDRLPLEVTAPLQQALVRELNAEELCRALQVAMDALLAEMRRVDAALGARLDETLRDLVRTAATGPWA